jgi:hypothetical protein
MDQWPLHSSFTLVTMPNAAFWARRHAEEVLGKWGLGTNEEFAYRVKLVVSELVTNATKASGGLTDEKKRRYDHHPMSIPAAELTRLGQVRLRLFSDGRRQVLIAVWDRSGEPPEMCRPEPDAESGRGLLLVGNLCTGWGWYPVRNRESANHGKVVWATVAAGDG